MSVAEAGAGHASKRRRWLLWSLTASLALNGFLIGALLTGLFAGQPERRGMLFVETRAIGENLPDEEAQALRAAMREMIPDMRDDWRRLRNLRREINALAAEPEPDRETIDARLAEIRDITREIQAAVQTRVFDEVLALPPQVRAGLVPDGD